MVIAVLYKDNNHFWPWNARLSGIFDMANSWGSGFARHRNAGGFRESLLQRNAEKVFGLLLKNLPFGKATINHVVLQLPGNK